MNETVFDLKVNGDSIYGIWHPSVAGKNVAAVFLHGWAGHRPGPHDMLVKLARRLSNNGSTVADSWGKGSRNKTCHSTDTGDAPAAQHIIGHVCREKCQS
jgi:hypothetical protein